MGCGTGDHRSFEKLRSIHITLGYLFPTRQWLPKQCYCQCILDNLGYTSHYILSLDVRLEGALPQAGLDADFQDIWTLSTWGYFTIPFGKRITRTQTFPNSGDVSIMNRKRWPQFTPFHMMPSMKSWKAPWHDVMAQSLNRNLVLVL